MFQKKPSFSVVVSGMECLHLDCSLPIRDSVSEKSRFIVGFLYVYRVSLIQIFSPVLDNSSHFDENVFGRFARAFEYLETVVGGI